MQVSDSVIVQKIIAIEKTSWDGAEGTRDCTAAHTVPFFWQPVATAPVCISSVLKLFRVTAVFMRRVTIFEGGAESRVLRPSLSSCSGDQAFLPETGIAPSLSNPSLLMKIGLASPASILEYALPAIRVGTLSIKFSPQLRRVDYGWSLMIPEEHFCG
jgi:hypothetical protein